MKTISDIQKAMMSDITVRWKEIAGSDKNIPLLPRSFLYAITFSISTFLKLLGYDTCDKLLMNSMPETCDENKLLEIGEEVNILPLDEAFCVVVVEFEGGNGITINADTQFYINNQIYKTVENFMIHQGTTPTDYFTEELEALGSDITYNNVRTGDVVTPVVDIVTPPQLTPITAIRVRYIKSRGYPKEDIIDYRKRVINKKRFPPQGGSKSDYVNWALAYPGISSVTAVNSGGTIIITPVFHGTGSQRVLSVPECDIMRSHMIAQGLPMTVANVQVKPPIVLPVNFTLSGLYPDSPELRAKIEKIFREFVDKLRPKTFMLDEVEDTITVSSLYKECYYLGAYTINIVFTVGNVAGDYRKLDYNELLDTGTFTWV